LKERYEDNLSTHPDLDLDLLLEARLLGGPNRNQVYEHSNTMAENLLITCSVLTVGCSQSLPSTQTLGFAVMLNQQVQDETTHLDEKYEQLIADYEELRRVIIEMRSHNGDPCFPPY